MRGLSALVQDKALVDGAWVDSSNSKATFEVRNPANGAVIGKVPNMNVADAQQAINAAKQAYESKEWRSLTAKDRSNLLKVSAGIIPYQGLSFGDQRSRNIYYKTYTCRRAYLNRIEIEKKPVKRLRFNHMRIINMFIKIYIINRKVR